MARNSRELARRPRVDPADEPSVEWGWHGSFPNGTRIAGLLSAASIVLMVVFGHGSSGTEYAWSLAFAAVILAGVIGLSLRRRHSWRR